MARFHRLRLHKRLCPFYERREPQVPSLFHGDRLASPLDHDDPFYGRAEPGCLIGDLLEEDYLAPPVAPVRGVMMTFALRSLTRSAMDWALNPEKMTVCTAPMRAQASMKMGSSGIIGR